MMETGDHKIGAAQVSVAGFGAGTAQAAEYMHHFALADVAAALTIAYTAFMLGCSIYDRFFKKGRK